MQATIEKDDLLKFAAAAGKIKGAKTDAVLRADDHSITAQIRDKTTTLSMALRAKVERCGSVICPIAKIATIAAAANQPIELSATDDMIDVFVGRSKFRVPVPYGAAMVAFPDVHGLGAAWEIESRELARIARLTTFVTDANETKFAIGGTRIGLNGADLVAEATDGKRVSHLKVTAYSRQSAFVPSGQYGTVIPTDAVQLVGYLANAGDPSDGWAVAWDGSANQTASTVTFWNQATKTAITSQLLTGRFPAIGTIWPDKADLWSTVTIENTAAFAAAIQAASITTTKESVGIVIESTDDRTVTWSSNFDAGDSTIEVGEACTVKGRPFAITFNHRYAAQAFAAVGSGPSRLELYRGGKPAVLVGDRFTHALMPINASEVFMPRIVTSEDYKAFTTGGKS